jgi:hypothetical protein
MLRVLEIITAVVLAALFFLAIGLFLPKTARITRTQNLANPMNQVVDSLNGFHKFRDWSPWGGQNVPHSLSGERHGEGARVEFTSTVDPNASGTMELVETEVDDNGAQFIRMRLDNGWSGDNKRSSFKISQDGKTKAVTVQWDVRVDYGWNIIGRYKGMYLDGTLGESMEESLRRYANSMAQIPFVQYSQMPIDEVDLPGGTVLYVGGGVPASPRKFEDEALPLMERSWSQVSDFMRANNVTPTGPRIRQVVELGEETHNYNMAYPVADANVAVRDNVRIGTAYAGKALRLRYEKQRVGIGVPRGARDALRAYAMTHGLGFSFDGSGQFEEWLDETNENGYFITNVYLPVSYTQAQ